MASYAVNHGNNGMMGAFGMHDRNDSNDYSGNNLSSGSNGMMGQYNDGSLSMSGMMANLNGLSGDAFDKVFLSEMILHHQGAINMAQLAAGQAKHQEVKDLANGIVTAQTSEIAKMQQWQKEWGY